MSSWIRQNRLRSLVAVKASYVLINWKLRLVYVLVGASAGVFVGRTTETSVPLWVAASVCVCVLRIWSEIRQRDRGGAQ